LLFEIRGNIFETTPVRSRPMARVDEEAAERELQKAAECDAQADELLAIAESLRSRARHHEQEAEELRGHVPTENVH
jgi:hypothetical protein